MDAIKENTVAAENQIKKEQMVFYVGDPTAKCRIAVVGNSITRHGIKEEIGWNRLCGMAASDEDHDYVHRLYQKMKEAGKEAYVMGNQLSYWEHHYQENILENYGDIRDFDADYFIFRLGENIGQDFYMPQLDEYIDEMTRTLVTEKTQVILTTCFWKNPPVDEAIRKVAEKRGFPLVELGDLGDLPEMKAYGLFASKGVAAHPGDLGMEHIAERIFSCIQSL